MIGLVIVTHGDFGAVMMRATEHVVGPLAQATTVAIGPDDDMERSRDAIAAAIAANDDGSGVMIATDLFGGTPTNLAISLMSDRVEVVAGMNLPMMIRFAGARRRESLADTAVAMREAGRKYINRAAEILGEAVGAPEEPVATPSGPHDVVIETLVRAAEDLARLRELMIAQSRHMPSAGMIGHNLPPPAFTMEDRATLDDGAVALAVSGTELASATPDRSVLQLCVAALKRVLSLLRQIAHWALAKGNLFIDEAAKSAGKAVGPALVAASVAAGLSDEIGALITYLRGVIGL